LRFSGRAAQLVRERNWHASQQIQELADGSLELALTLNSLEEIIPWVLSWGKNCEVVRPTKLRGGSGPFVPKHSRYTYRARVSVLP
jgi:predicted DNA-binding transcriptional regulator YafY